jgi:quercetin dioxygenase-like cupin family protein
MTFNPKLRKPFSDCIKSVEDALKAVGHGHPHGQKILTSRDKDAAQLRTALNRTNVPQGFSKWQLPYIITGASAAFITVASAGAKVPSHDHEGESDLLIVSGSIILNGHQELTSGDWAFIPANTAYSYEVGPMGAMLKRCYPC